jgi:lipoyl(octanoyl) transferase
MAADATLLARVQPDRAVWRWYAWDQPTVSFGRNEAVRDRFSSASLRRAGLAAVRRPTGGRALLHVDELTYAVVLPLPKAVGWRDAYAAVNALLADALCAVGVPVTIAPPRREQISEGAVCFDAPDEGELLLHGRKLMGSAVWRQGEGYLQHGSLLLRDRQELLTSAAELPLPPVPPAASLGDVHPPKALPTVLARFKTAVADRLANWGEWPDAGAVAHTGRANHHSRISAFEPEADLLAAIDLQATRFSREDWLWRR